MWFPFTYARTRIKLIIQNLNKESHHIHIYISIAVSLIRASEGGRGELGLQFSRSVTLIWKLWFI